MKLVVLFNNGVVAILFGLKRKSHLLISNSRPGLILFETRPDGYIMLSERANWAAQPEWANWFSQMGLTAPVRYQH
jgi:hypothetical protein